MQVDGVELERACLLTVQTVHYGNEPCQSVFIIDMHVAVVGGHITRQRSVLRARTVIVLVARHIGGTGGIVIPLIDGCTASHRGVDNLCPVVVGAVVGYHLGVVRRDHIGGGVLVEGGEIPHQESVARQVGLRLQVYHVALTEEHVSQVVAVLLVDILVELVVAVHSGNDAACRRVSKDDGGNLDSFVVTVADSLLAVCGNIRDGIRPAVGARHGLPLAVVARDILYLCHSVQPYRQVFRQRADSRGIDHNDVDVGLVVHLIMHVDGRCQ